VIWGAAGHALVVREALGGGAPPIVAVFDRDDVTPPFADVPLFSGPRALRDWLQTAGDVSNTGFVVAIGGSRGPDRLEIHHRLLSAGLLPVSVIHGRAFVASGAVCGDGSQVLALAAVCQGASIGTQTIVNTSASVDHECVIGSGVHIGPGAHLAGLVTVGDNATVGTGAVVLPRIAIGEGAIIGAGAVVNRDIPPHVTMVGNPAREVGP
jgi:sugar O-acyltransferase (sialic acid O-acetyltransferase NeuD family)